MAVALCGILEFPLAVQVDNTALSTCSNALSSTVRCSALGLFPQQASIFKIIFFLVLVFISSLDSSRLIFHGIIHYFPVRDGYSVANLMWSQVAIQDSIGNKYEVVAGV